MSPSGQNNTNNENQRNNNSTTILRRASLAEKLPKKDIFPEITNKKCNNNLPDVLPLNAKVTRSQYSPPNSPKNNYPIQKSVSNETNNRLTPNSPDLKNFPIQKSYSNESMKSPVYINPPSPIKDQKIDNHIYMNSPPISPQKETPPFTPTPKDSPPYINPPSPTQSQITQAVNPLYMSPPYISPPKTPPSSSPKTSQKVSSPSPNSPVKSDSFEFDGSLQLMQRTEVTLRVNTNTSDAAIQTETEELATPLPVRRKFQEEIECEKLSQDLVNYLSPSDRLKGILGKSNFL